LPATEKLYGTSDYYSIDPFHEAKSLPAGLDFGKAGKAIMDAMKKANPKAVWVVQGWTENPRPEMMKALNPGDLLILAVPCGAFPLYGNETKDTKNTTGCSACWKISVGTWVCMEGWTNFFIIFT